MSAAEDVFLLLMDERSGINSLAVAPQLRLGARSTRPGRHGKSNERRSQSVRARSHAHTPACEASRLVPEDVPFSGPSAVLRTSARVALRSAAQRSVVHLERRSPSVMDGGGWGHV